MVVNVLGTDYEILTGCEEEDYPYLKEADGYIDTTTKKIIISKMKVEDNTYQDIQVYENKVIRHELVHAFLHESGLDINSDWACNEEIVDWIALQLPKMVMLFETLDVM